MPKSNPLTTAKVALGERLFFDPVLSVDRSIACASCHRPERAFSDTVPLSRGVYGRRTARNAPSIVNRAYGRAFFRDGRSPTLEETVLQPIQNPVEMDLRLAELLLRLGSDESYRHEFDGAFDDGITERNVGAALASYVRTLRSGNAPIDRFLAGGERVAVLHTRRHVRIIHGHGTGVLRRSIAGLLETHPQVARFAPAQREQGGTGVTVVDLKD